MRDNSHHPSFLFSPIQLFSSPTPCSPHHLLPLNPPYLYFPLFFPPLHQSFSLHITVPIPLPPLSLNLPYISLPPPSPYTSPCLSHVCFPFSHSLLPSLPLPLSSLSFTYPLSFSSQPLPSSTSNVPPLPITYIPLSPPSLEKNGWRREKVRQEESNGERRE